MLSGDKSPGEDMIPPEVFLSNQSWWAPILASLFTTINATLKIPPNWKQSIVIPIHKKGDPQDPRNYRPISLLDISYKVYSRFLLEKLIEWAEETKLFHPEQAGFRKGHSTSGQCLVLLTLIDKYLNRFNCKLHAAFVDLTSAFDSIPRDRLWQKLSYTNIDKRLLLLLMEIHNDISARVKFGPLGALSDSFPLNKGVKQGCLLAPFLFNFYINDIVTTMKALNQSAPSLQQLKIPILLYADDMVILSLTKLGLNNTLRGLMTYCDTNSLKINFAKTKILTFGTKTRKSLWNFEGHSIEYCSAFKYLGIIFQHGLSWSAHLNTTILAARRTIKALEKFYYAKGGQLVPPIRKAFISKVLPMLLYGVEIWGWNLKTLQRLEILQNSFARKVLGLPKGSVAAQLRTELGLPSIVARAHIRIISFYCKLINAPGSLLARQAFLTCSQSNKWSKAMVTITARYSLPNLDSLSSWDKHKIRAWILTRDEAMDRAQSTSARLSMWLPKVKVVRSLANYLIDLTEPNFRRAFTMARFHSIPTAFLQGIYSKTPITQRLCPCTMNEVEDFIHFFFYCPIYEPIRSKLLLLIPSTITSKEDCLEIASCGRKSPNFTWGGNLHSAGSETQGYSDRVACPRPGPVLILLLLLTQYAESVLGPFCALYISAY
uniref:ribonuclease H n=1 Tax=Podarcis muralis TaxID=64176 RepID=A0A670JBD8_PODMU